MEYIYIFVAAYLAIVLGNETNKFLITRKKKVRDWFIKKIKRPIKRWIRKVKRKRNKNKEI